MREFLLIAGMSIVTMVPRLVPALFNPDRELPDWFEKWLESLPYAALGALIFPGIILVDQEQPLLGLIGGVTAVVLSVLKLDLTLVMAGSVLVALAYENLF